MAFSIILIVPILIIAVIGLIVAGTRNGSEGGEQVIKNVYIYLVLFATLMMVIGGSVAAFMATADLFAPAPYHQTFEDFKRWGVEKEVMEEDVKLSEEELRERYDSMVQSENERQSARAKNSLIKSFGWIVIPLPIFIYFQKRLLKSKE